MYRSLILIFLYLIAFDKFFMSRIKSILIEALTILFLLLQEEMSRKLKFAKKKLNLSSKMLDTELRTRFHRSKEKHYMC